MDAVKPIAIDQVNITDQLFSKYVRLVAEKIVPYQWEALNDRIPNQEKSHCLDNFRVAAGDQQGRHQGAIFQDTDLYKWLEAVAFCIANGTGRQFIPLADEAVELIGRAQQPDGYLNTYITIECPENRWKNLAEGHELYGAGHLIEAAVAYYNATGKEAILNIARRFADLIDQTFGDEDGKCHGYPGHQEIELALVKLYRVTGEQRYLRLADYFIRRRGGTPNYLLEEMAGRHGKNVFPEFAEYDDKYAQTHLPPVEQTTAEGHAVRAVYMYSAMADLAMTNDDKALEQACRTLYDNIVERRMYITGGIGSSGKLERFTADFDLPNDRMYCESCASIGLMMFGQRMAALTGEAKYYDAVELALCNTVLAGISLEGDRYFYVNPLEVWPDNCLPSTSMSHVKPVRQPWFSCACCPPNIARTLASLAQYIYSTGDDTLYIQQFISSEVETTLANGPVKVSMVSSCMENGTVRIAAEGKCTLRIRLPWYLEQPVLTVNGTVQPLHLEQGYLVVPVEGKTELQLTGQVPAHFVAADLRVRADLGQLAVMKGPFVYCLEQQDNGERLPALYTSPDAPLEELPPDETLGALPLLSFPGKRLVSTTGGAGLYSTPRLTTEPVTIRAVPYAVWGNRTPGEMQVWMKASV